MPVGFPVWYPPRTFLMGISYEESTASQMESREAKFEGRRDRLKKGM